MSLDLPAQPGPARDAAILDHIRNQDYQISWATIVSDVNGHHGEFRVFADALKIQGVRITMSAYLEQTVADMLGCTLLTAKLADLLYAQKTTTLAPHPQIADATMVSTAVMEKQSAWIDSQVTAASPGIVQTVGKHWIIDNLFKTSAKGKAINYGWHFQGALFNGLPWYPSVTLPGVRMIQSRGWAHAAQEVDYSQNCVLVARTCFVDGLSRDILDIYQDAELAPLVNSSGILSILRQPGVPQAPFLGRPTPCTGPNCPNMVLWEEDAEITQPRTGLVVAGTIAIFAVIGGFFGGLALLNKH